VTRRHRFLIIAVLLTFLDVAVVVFRGWPVWATRSGDLWNRGLVVLLASLGATTLANVWAQVVPVLNDPAFDRRADREQTAPGIQVEERGQVDV